MLENVHHIKKKKFNFQQDIVEKFKIEVPLIRPMKQQPTVLKESNLPNYSDSQQKNASYEGKGKGKGKNKRIDS